MMKLRKIFLLAMITWAALISMGCGGTAPDGAGQQSAATEEIEAQVVAQPPPTFTPTAELRTELPAAPISPISPISPVSPTIQKDESTMAITPIPGGEEALAAAKEDLSQQTNVPVTEIELVSMEAVEWNDSSLGCPQEGYMYAQVITPGYKLVLSAQGQEYEYHADQRSNVVLCQQ